jgi:general secretion pathway protein B
MSYILDALKKSEKERQRGTVPDILTTQEPLSQEPKKRPLLLYLLLSAILFNTGLLVWLMSPWQSKKPNLIQLTDRQQSESKLPESPSPDLSKTNSPEVKMAMKEEAPKVAPQQAGATAHVSSEQKLSNREAPLPNKIYNLNELPLSIQQSLPTFAISVSLYSDDPASRMAKINGQVMKEGQYLTAGLKLEEIIPDGVILSYQNYRFRVGLR